MTWCIAAASASAATADDDDGVAYPASKTASKFYVEHHLAHVAAPVGPEAYYPARIWIDDLVAKQAESDREAERSICKFPRTGICCERSCKEVGLVTEELSGYPDSIIA